MFQRSSGVSSLPVSVQLHLDIALSDSLKPFYSSVALVGHQALSLPLASPSYPQEKAPP
jgi:hypothetical protein